MQHIKAVIGIGLAAICSLSLAVSASAQAQPEGPVILEISGAISAANSNGAMQYDRQMLESLELHEITTETPWTEGTTVFQGVLAQDLMNRIGADGNTVTAIALNDYSVDIPITDFADFGVILALRRDGAYMSVRDRGPIWVIYPWSDDTDLQNELYYSPSIWQLKALIVAD